MYVRTSPHHNLTTILKQGIFFGFHDKLLCKKGLLLFRGSFTSQPTKLNELLDANESYGIMRNCICPKANMTAPLNMPYYPQGSININITQE